VNSTADVLSLSTRDHRLLSRRLARAVAGDDEEVQGLLADVILHEALERTLVYPELDDLDERPEATRRQIEQDNISWLVEHVVRAREDRGAVLLALQRAVVAHFDREELESHPSIWRRSSEERLWQLAVRWEERGEQLRAIQRSAGRYLCLEELCALRRANPPRTIDLTEHEATAGSTS
jgi:hypothetical protein